MSAPNDVVKPELAGGFSRRSLITLFSIGIGALVLAVILMLFGEDIARKPTHEPNTFSYSAIGHRAAAVFLRDSGIGVLARQTRAGIATGPDTPLIVAEPDVGYIMNDQTNRMGALQAEALRKNAPLVLVLPKWTGDAMRKKKGWIQRRSLYAETDVERVLETSVHTDVARMRVQRTGEDHISGCVDRVSHTRLDLAIDYPQFLPDDGTLRPIVTCTGGVLIGVAPGTGDAPATYFISDPDFFNNQGLGRADNAALLYSFLVDFLGARGVVFDETVHGFVRRAGLFYEATRFPLVIAVLQALVFLGMVLWAGLFRFGKPVRTPPGLEAAGKAVLIDNTAKLLGFGGHSGWSLHAYFGQTVNAVARHYFLPTTLTDDEVLERLQKIAESRHVSLNLFALRRMADQLRRTAKKGNDERVVRFARQLHHWRTKMTTT